MAKFRIEDSVSIDSPVSEVFQFVAEPTNRDVWQLSLVEVQREGDKRWREARTWMGRRVEEIYEEREREDNVRLVNQSRPGEGSPLEIKDEYQFSGDGNQTMLTHVLEMDTGDVFPGDASKFEHMVRREVNASLERLKDVLEADDDTRQVAESLPGYSGR